MRSLLRELQRKHGGEFTLQGADTVLFRFGQLATEDDVRDAVRRMRDVRPGVVAVLRQGVPWRALP